MDIRDWYYTLQPKNSVARNAEGVFNLGTKGKFFAVTSVSNLCWFTSQDIESADGVQVGTISCHPDLQVRLRCGRGVIPEGSDTW